MNLEQIKYYTDDNGDDGILIVDIDEDTPQTDEYGNLQYYSPSGYTYSVSEDDDED